MTEDERQIRWAACELLHEQFAGHARVDAIYGEDLLVRGDPFGLCQVVGWDCRWRDSGHGEVDGRESKCFSDAIKTGSVAEAGEQNRRYGRFQL